MKFLIALLLPLSAHAASIGSCDGLNKIDLLIGNPKNLTEIGAKIAYVSTDEPAATPDHLLVITYGDDGYSECVSINATKNGQGFGVVNLEKAVAKEDSGRALVKIPVDVWTGIDGKYKHTEVKIEIKSGYPAPKVSLR